mgnify:CR=1 FL=1
MGEIIPKIRQSARGQECTIRIPGTCNGNPETTVWCHAPSPVKGMGNKGDDHWGAYGCSSCHIAIDEWHVKDPHKYWLEAIRRSQKILIELGLLKVPPVEFKISKRTEKIARVQRASKRSIPSRPFR